MSKTAEEEMCETLKLRFEDLRRENDRLRDARSEITKQLGPLPISAAVVAGLISGFATSGQVHLDRGLTYAALGTFLAMVIVSSISSVLQPYRRLREKVEKRGPKPDSTTTRADWYAQMIEVEQRVRGKNKEGLGSALARQIPVPLPWKAKTLQSACDQEWKGLFLTKLLFVAVIALLILARINA